MGEHNLNIELTEPPAELMLENGIIFHHVRKECLKGKEKRFYSQWLSQKMSPGDSH